MYCANCGKEIKEQGEGGYCKECDLYTATPTILKPQKHLSYTNQLLFILAIAFGIITHILCVGFDAYNPSDDMLLYVFLCLGVGLVPLIFTFLIYITELKRNIEQSNLFVIAAPCVIINLPFLTLCLRCLQAYVLY